MGAPHDELGFESTRTVSPAEFLALVEARARAGDLYHYELLNGRVVMSPPAGFPHGVIESQIVHRLQQFVGEHGLGVVMGSSQGYELPSGDTVEPDATYVSRERWDAAPPPEEGRFLRLVPDLAVEILSASTASRDRGEKKAIYERNGVREYWLVDWRAREITRFALGENGRFDAGVTFTVGERARSLCLPGLDVEVASLFPPG